jgi:uncharacterized protein (TIGR03437 family)
MRIAVLGLAFLSPALAQTQVCTGTPLYSSGPPSLRPRGQAELLGDLLLRCDLVGSPSGVTGTILVQLSGGPLASRVLQQDPVNASEALLLLDEPQPDQLLGQPAGTIVPGANAIQGIQQGSFLSFQNVALLTAGLSGSIQRTIRITNLRANVSALSPGNTISGSFSITSSPGVIVNNPTAALGRVGNPIAFAARTADDTNTFSFQINSCLGNNAPVTAASNRDFNLKFTESSPYDFRARTIGTTASDPVRIVNQTTYSTDPVFLSESGFFNGGGTNNFPGSNGMIQAGLATQGTRLAVRFTSVPQGSQIWVTSLPVQAGTSGSGISARLLVTDPNGAATGAFIAPTIGPFAQVPVVAGTALAVWEVYDANPSQIEAISFGAIVSVAAGSNASGQVAATGFLAPLAQASTTTPSLLPAPNFALNPPAGPVVADVRACVTQLTISTGCPLTAGTAGVPLALSMIAAGGELPYNWTISAGQLPPGVALASNGLMSGTPTQAGNYSFTLRVNDRLGAVATRDCSLTIAGALTISTACPLPDAPLSVPYAQRLAAGGGAPPYTWGVVRGALPTGLTLDRLGGLITGNPVLPGVFSFALQVADSRLAIGQKECSIRVLSPFRLNPATMSFTAPSGGAPTPPQIMSLTSDTPGQNWSIRVQTDSGGDWLRVTPSSGRIPAAAEVNVLPANLKEGNYTAVVQVGTTGTVQQALSIAVNLQVTPPLASQIALDPTGVVVTAARGGARFDRVLIVNNQGASPLTFSASAETLNGENWFSMAPAQATITNTSPARLRMLFSPSNLDPGIYRARVRVQNTSTGDVLTVPVNLGIGFGRDAVQVEPSALNFTVVPGGIAPPPQNFTVFSTGASGLTWQASVGPDPSPPGWLLIAPRSGRASPGGPSQGEVRIDTSQLIPGRYYGEVVVAAPGVDNAPRSVLVNVTVLDPATRGPAVVSPSGLFFTSQVGGANPATQFVTILNTGQTAVTFDTEFSGDSNLWTVTPPANRTINPGQTVAIDIGVNSARAQAGFARASLAVQVSGDPVVKTVDLVLASGPNARAASVDNFRFLEAFCPPGGLRLIATQGAAFATPAGLSMPVEALVYDQTGAPLTTGLLTAGIRGTGNLATLVHIASGRWIGTVRTPPGDGAPLILSFYAEDRDRGLTGCLDIAGATVTSAAPSIPSGGVLSTASYAPFAPIASGGMMALFGFKLADGTSSALSLPLSTDLGSTRVRIGNARAPLFFAGDLGNFSQVNGIIPYGLTQYVTLPVTVTQGSTLATSEVLIADAQPNVFTLSQRGTGQGIIVQGANPLIIADQANPVQAGQVIIIYCEGLGPVTPAIDAGGQTPSTGLTRTTLPVKVLIDGREAAVQFAGLTPGLAGLYQVNAVVPAGVAPGNAVPVVLTVNGQSSPPVTIAVRP